MANSGVLGLTGNQLTEDPWLLGSCPIFSVRKLTKKKHANYRLLGVKYLTHLENLGKKKKCIVHLGFFYYMRNRK